MALNQSDQVRFLQPKIVNVSQDQTLTVRPSQAYNIFVTSGKLTILSSGYSGYYGQASLLIYCKEGSVQVGSNAMNRVSQIKGVDTKFETGKTYLCSIRFFGQYARFYIIDTWDRQ